ncbi:MULTISPECIES: helix-turn-helix domain-containing protein [unclassified Blastococcus]
MADDRPDVPTPEPAVDVSDPRVLRALSHPLRSGLLSLLRLEGPSTATRLGRRLGESSGATSYHLRQLAAFGLVEEVLGGDGRERWWRAVHRSTRWSSEGLADAGGAEVVGELTQHLLRQQTRVLAALAGEHDDLSEEERATVSLNDWALRLSPARARELTEELNGVLARWRAEEEDPEEPVVHVLLDVFPLHEYPL